VGFVNGGGVLQNRLDAQPLAAVRTGLPALVKTAVPAGVASDAGVVTGLGDAEQNHVVVAIEPDVVHSLHMAGLFALEPQLAARATEIHRAAEFSGFLQGLAVHPRKHQHIFAALLLRDDRHQALRVPFDSVEPIHRLMLRAAALRPTSRMTRMMDNGQYVNQIIFHRIKDTIWKSRQKGASNPWNDFCIQKRSLFKTFELQF